MENINLKDQLVFIEAELFSKDLKFTPLQQDIMFLMAQGLQNKEIASKLEIHLGDLEMFILLMCGMAGVKSQSELMAKFIAWVIIKYALAD